eukprot:CAMPEP_0171612644 /NCGR_PEP_ID=MMETSP0990-20121206/11320_1 /TAXON_ID=483369 /ORGANISM="non described non described, Strain CCMP2098" /LENGTH=94 /DNA_ID=CAMNT_0012176389 /DNA_START=258 /DNA_END=543 /DNA_ORIENTATION=+
MQRRRGRCAPTSTLVRRGLKRAVVGVGYYFAAAAAAAAGCAGGLFFHRINDLALGAEAVENDVAVLVVQAQQLVLLFQQPPPEEADHTRDHGAG